MQLFKHLFLLVFQLYSEVHHVYDIIGKYKVRLMYLVLYYTVLQISAYINLITKTMSSSLIGNLALGLYDFMFKYYGRC